VARVSPSPNYLEVGGRRIAWRGRDGGFPTLLFLPGYASDMDGAKALALDSFAARRGLAMVRFDYSGTGLSDGDFAEGTLDRWLGEALAMLDRRADGPVILIGSSMGGWLALHLALERPDRIAALIGIAAAPDFTDWGFDDAQRGRLQRDGRIDDGGAGITQRFWSSGQQMLLLEKPIALDCPVRLVHGELDREVPLPVAYRLLQQVQSPDLRLTIVKHGGHRLSEPNEIAAILDTTAALVEQVQSVPRLPN
jgi:pimeloyl-ACP methyl ester carboxylesterase